jgi:dTDP-4-dehydrorhamnose 3,5-epimerase-like enzyme
MIESKMNSVDDVSKFIVTSHSKENSTLRIYDVIYQSGAIRSFLISSNTDDTRGNHSHTRSRQWFTAVPGRITVEVYDGKETKTFSLQDSNEILLVPAGIWSRQIYSENSILLVFTDTQYDETDYIRSFAEFEQWKIT